jgi:hypothetical protein
MRSIHRMENEINLSTMSQEALINFIKQLWKRIDRLETDNQKLKLDNQKLKLENGELKNALARAKK